MMSLSCLTGPLFIRGLHLLCVLYSFCVDISCYCPRPLSLHHGLPALQLPLHPVEDLCCGPVDLAASFGDQLPSPARMGQCQLCGSHVQLCSQLGQQSQLHSFHGCPLLPHTSSGHPLLLREHRQGSPKPCQEDPYIGRLCATQQESKLSSFFSW